MLDKIFSGLLLFSFIILMFVGVITLNCIFIIVAILILILMLVTADDEEEGWK